MAMPTFATALLGLSGLLVILIVFIILSYLFWLWMFIHALGERDTLWITLFVLSFFTGLLEGILASIYYFQVYRVKKSVDRSDKRLQEAVFNDRDLHEEQFK